MNDSEIFAATRGKSDRREGAGMILAGGELSESFFCLIGIMCVAMYMSSLHEVSCLMVVGLV